MMQRKILFFILSLSFFGSTFSQLKETRLFKTERDSNLGRIVNKTSFLSYNDFNKIALVCDDFIYFTDTLGGLLDSIAVNSSISYAEFGINNQFHYYSSEDKIASTYFFYADSSISLKVESVKEWYRTNSLYKEVFDSFLVLNSISCITKDDDLIEYELNNIKTFYNLKRGNGGKFYQFLEGLVIEYSNDLLDKEMLFFKRSSLFSELLYCNLNEKRIVYKTPFSLMFYDLNSKTIKRVHSFEKMALFDNNLVGNRILGVLRNNNNFEFCYFE